MNCNKKKKKKQKQKKKKKTFKAISSLCTDVTSCKELETHHGSIHHKILKTPFRDDFRVLSAAITS